MDKHTRFISSALKTMRSEVDQDTVAAAFDPRSKTLVTMFFIISVVSYSKYSVSELLPYFSFPFFMIVTGNISFLLLIKRMLPAAFFALMIGAANPFLDSNQIIFYGFALSAGWISFLSIFIRFCLCVSGVFLLIMTTDVYKINLALSFFGVPRVFINQMFFMERYVSLLAEEALKISRARSARAFGGKGYEVSVFINIVSNLLIRAFIRAENIFNAMRSRGFSGTMNANYNLNWNMKDTLFIVLWTTFFACLRFDLMKDII